MIILGLTGSIGMGKTTIADMFKENNVPVYSADDAVHQLYQEENTIILLEKLFANIAENGVVNRQKLAQYLIKQPEKLAELEKIIHPLARQKMLEFIENAKKRGDALIVVDIPLLFESGADKFVDKILVVSAPFLIQKKRVLARENMNEEKFKLILNKQLPDEGKRFLADYIIDTNQDIAKTQHDVKALIDELCHKDKDKG